MDNIIKMMVDNIVDRIKVLDDSMDIIDNHIENTRSIQPHERIKHLNQKIMTLVDQRDEHVEMLFKFVLDLDFHAYHQRRISADPTAQYIQYKLIKVADASYYNSEADHPHYNKTAVFYSGKPNGSEMHSEWYGKTDLGNYGGVSTAKFILEEAK